MSFIEPLSVWSAPQFKFIMEGSSKAARDIVSLLDLSAHPEGGYYRRIYEAEGECIVGESRVRKYGSGIYYLLEQGQHSAMHRIKSDELWHHYSGSTLRVHEIFPDGTLKVHLLGKNLEAGERPFAVVTAGSWFGADLPPEAADYALVGCTVIPAFSFDDFELAVPKELSAKFPQHRELIEALAPKAYLEG